MLNGMVAKGTQEKHDDEESFRAFKHFCDLTRAGKSRTINAADQEIEKLTTVISKAKADADQFAKDITQLDASLESWKTDAKQAKKVRNDERAAFASTDLDYSESIGALQRAIQILKLPRNDVAQKTVALSELTRVISSTRSPASEVGALLKSFLQERAVTSTMTSLGAPEANAYEFQSQGVVDLLDKLLKRFVEERNVLVTEEANRRHSYELLCQQIISDSSYAQRSRGEKATTKARRLQDSARATADLAETSASKTADVTYLDALDTESHQKSKDFEARQTLRAAEIGALQQAIHIISSSDVADAAEKYSLPSLMELHSDKSRTAESAGGFMQLRSNSRQPTAQARAAAFLKKGAESLNSALLLSLAIRVDEDPFSKVRQLVKELLDRLMQEATEEANHKMWCDTELSMNKLSRDMKSAEVDDLQFQVDEMSAKAATLGQDISDLSDAVADIDAGVAQATAIRQDERQKNAATAADAKVAQDAVAAAVALLRDFYAKASGATAFSQQTPSQDAPSVLGGTYQGMQAASTGVIGMLEVIQSDFSRLLAETESSDDEAQREFEKFMVESNQDKAVKQKEAHHKQTSKESLLRKLSEAKRDLEAVQGELTASLDYYEKLKPSCINVDSSYSERKARRAEELENLKQALRILNGEDIA